MFLIASPRPPPEPDVSSREPPASASRHTSNQRTVASSHIGGERWRRQCRACTALASKPARPATSAQRSRQVPRQRFQRRGDVERTVPSASKKAPNLHVATRRQARPASSPPWCAAACRSNSDAGDATVAPSPPPFAPSRRAPFHAASPFSARPDVSTRQPGVASPRTRT